MQEGSSIKGVEHLPARPYDWSWERLTSAALAQILLSVGVGDHADVLVLGELASGLSRELTHLHLHQLPTQPPADSTSLADAVRGLPTAIVAEDDRFDALICCLHLASLPPANRRQALAEAVRVGRGPILVPARPDGAASPLPPLWPELEPLRPTVDEVTALAEQAGLNTAVVPVGHLTHRSLLLAAQMALGGAGEDAEQLLDWYVGRIAPFDLRAPAVEAVVVIGNASVSVPTPESDPQDLAAALELLRTTAHAARALHPPWWDDLQKDLANQRDQLAELGRRLDSVGERVGGLAVVENERGEQHNRLVAAQELVETTVAHQTAILERALGLMTELRLPEPPPRRPPAPPPDTAREVAEWKRRAVAAEQGAREARRQLREAMQSESMRAGRVVTAPLRAVARALRRRHRS